MIRIFCRRTLLVFQEQGIVLLNGHNLMTQLMVLHGRWPHGSDTRIRGLMQRRRIEIEDQFKRDTMDSSLSKKVTAQAYEPGHLYRFAVVPHIVLQIDKMEPWWKCRHMLSCSTSASCHLRAMIMDKNCDFIRDYTG